MLTTENLRTRKIKEAIRKLFHTFGYDVTSYSPNRPGRSPFVDMERFVHSDERILIFDVGANVGQSIHRFKDAFPASIIHSFEPSPATFRKLRENVEGINDIQLWNCALGSSIGHQMFYVNTYSDMSSFLRPSEFAWGAVESEISVDVKTIDETCEVTGIERIDILKCDTQGYELEVLKGASRMMERNRIGLLYFEVTFSDMYEGAPRFDQLFQYLIEHNFLLVSFYEFHYQRGLASWTDALFVNRPW